MSRDARNCLPFRCTSNNTNIATLCQIVGQELSECDEEKFVPIKMVIRIRSLNKDNTKLFLFWPKEKGERKDKNWSIKHYRERLRSINNKCSFYILYCILFTSFKPWQDIAEILQIVAKHQSFNQEILLFNRNQIEPK